MKLPTIVDIFIYINKENFMFIWAEHEKKFVYNLQFTIFQRNFPIRTPNNHMNCNVEKQGRYSDSVDIRINLGHWLSLVHVRWYNNPGPFCSDNTHSFPINALEWNLVFVLPFSKSKFKHFPSLTFSYL